MDLIERRQDERLRFLVALYEVTEGRTHESRLFADVVRRAGLRHEDTVLARRFLRPAEFGYVVSV
jgi:hypothetical protein